MSNSLFKARLSGDISPVFKQDGEFVVWGPASVTVVDKENDLIRAEALRDALPQLLKRKRVSLDHSDQLVGDILDSHDTDEPTEVEVNGEVLERSTFPTGVLTPEEDDVPEEGLYVASKIFDDTRQAREVREKIERGDYDSYSISGESISSTTKVEDGSLVDDISELDLSAVTICEEGMNQRAEFGIVSKLNQDASGGASSGATAVAKEDTSNMTDPEGGLTAKQLREEVQGAAEEVLPDGELATKEYIDEEIEDRLSEKAADDADTQEAIEMLAEANEGLSEDDVRSMVEEGAAMGEAEAEEKGDDEMPEEFEEEQEDEDEEEKGDEEEMDEDEEDDDMEKEVPVSQLKSELPEDLYDAVSKQMGFGDDDSADEATDPVADAAAKADDPVEKAVGESFVEAGVPGEDADAPFGDESDIEKDDEVSADVGTLDAFYAEVDN